jgi:3-dehydroquinate dehydratase-1
MRLCANPPLRIRGIEFGGPQPLFCIPLVARTLSELLAQAEVAHDLHTDIVEWRADSYDDFSEDAIAQAADALRKALPRELILFTPRTRQEGGAREIAWKSRLSCIHRLLSSTSIDLVDVELSNGPTAVTEVVDAAHQSSKHVIVSFHDFEKTPASDFLSEKISAMIHHRADVAKIACMPRTPEDVLRLLEVTLVARRAFPSTALCTISMGGLGVLSRVAGCLYGSDMTFAAGAASSAPGQVPIAEARALTDLLLRNA